MINARLGENNNINCTIMIEKRLKSRDAKTDFQTRLYSVVGRIIMIKNTIIFLLLEHFS
jgi:hypothetical protein